MSARSPLERSLADVLDGQVRFDAGARGLYATTGANYRQVPIAVATPRSVEQLVAGLTVCREHGVPVLMRGGGTSLAGQSVNAAVIFDASQYLTRILAIDPEARTARVEPGVVLDDLRRAAEPYDLTFGPDPSTHAYCTLGGMIGNNSCGVHSVTAGRTSDNVESLDVITGDGIRLRVGATPDDELARLAGQPGRQGEIYAGIQALRDRYAGAIRQRFPDIPRRVSGFGLDELLPERGCHVARSLVGTEGTCVTILEATVRLVPRPRVRTLIVLGFEDVYAAADAVPDVLDCHPHGLEGLDERLVSDVRRQALHSGALSLLPDGGGWLLVEFGGDSAEEAREAADVLVRRFRGRPAAPSMKHLDDPGEQHRVWLVRESGLGATAHVPGEPLTWEGWEDAAVPPARLGDYLREFRALLDRHGYVGDLYGHFGDGCVHTRIDFDFRSADGVRQYRRFLDAAADLVVRFGGSLSGEHGDGQARGALLPKMFGGELMTAFREFRRLWDPEGRLNPGKVVDADPPDAHLRLTPELALPRVHTHFAYADDDGDFSRAMLRCVGVGACRKTDSGTMCPSYMVTREEAHSTRGRARLLFEMLRGDVVSAGWRDPHVKEALDLCLSCKGCKGECPVRVDMATYKAEFLAHYYAGRLRPRHAYAFGLIAWWARLGALAPWTAGQLMRFPPTAAVLKWIGGVAQERQLPRFAPETFRDAFTRRRSRALADGARVLLWPDTFNNHFHPEVALAAADVIEQLTGARVELPATALCCGRPLYDYGMLHLARRWLARVLDVLDEPLRAGVPIVVLEPSCASVFADELPNLFPHDERAKRLQARVVHFSEFLRQHVEDDDWPRLDRPVLLHGHCHQKALDQMAGEHTVLERLGCRIDAPDAGCCGMAGAFGFDPDHLDVSRQIGERVLLPAVREAAPPALVVANGFSCREQIAQEVGRRSHHLAEIVQLALGGPDPQWRRRGPARRERLLLSALVAAAATIAWWWSVRIRR